MPEFIFSLQDLDMMENIRNVYALPPVYILINHCDIADEEDDDEKVVIFILSNSQINVKRTILFTKRYVTHIKYCNNNWSDYN